MLVHGYQVAIQTCAGAGLFPHLVKESMKGFLEQSTRFLHSVILGDTLRPLLKVVELTPQRSIGLLGLRATIYNQHGVQALEGRHRDPLRLRSR